MIHLLAVGDPASLGGEPPPSFEVLHAATAEEAVEKLARNRRIDAVLFLDAALAAETLALLAEDSAAAPPMFSAEAVSAAVTRLNGSAVFEEIALKLGE